MRLPFAVPALIASACLIPIAAGDAPVAPPAQGPAAAAPTPAPFRMPEAQRAALMALYDRAVAAGLPDAKGAVLVLGKVELTVPEAESNRQRMSMGMQRRMYRGTSTQTADGKTTTTYEGLHLRLADGRWLLGLTGLLAVDDTHRLVQDPTARELAPAALAAAVAEKPSGRLRMQRGDDQFTALVTETDRPAVTAMLETARQLQDVLSFGIVGTTPALHLMRAGVPEADAVLVLGSIASQMPFGRMQQPWLESGTAPISFSEDGGWAMRRRMGGIDWETWQKDHAGKLAIGDATGEAANWLAAWFHGLLLNPDDLAAARLAPAAAAGGALALTPSDRQPGLKRILDLLIARAGVPAKAPDGADLAVRLQSWEPIGQDEGDGPQIDAEMLSKLPPEVQRDLRERMERRKAWRPSEGDIATLLALAGDPRPTRWLDGGTPRTLGDNAIRAIATVVGFDPRMLVGRDTGAPWTDAERSATAAALSGWWTSLGGKPLAEGLAASIASLPAPAMAQVLAARPEDARAPMLDAIAAAWAVHAPDPAEATATASILALAGDHAGIAGVVRGWKPDGNLRPLLACWRDRHGDPAWLDAMLDEVLAGPAQADGQTTAFNVFSQVLRTPSAERLKRLVAACASAPDDPRLWILLSAIGGNGGMSDDAWSAVMALDGDGRWGGRRMMRQSKPETDRSTTMPGALACILLADQRPVADNLLKIQAHGGDWASLTVAGQDFHFQRIDQQTMIARMRARQGQGANKAADKPEPERPAPTGLRVRDLAAIALMQSVWRFNQEAAGDLRDQRADPWAPPEKRDALAARMGEIFAESARPALAEAKLPDVVPAAAPPAGGDKALF